MNGAKIPYTKMTNHCEPLLRHNLGLVQFYSLTIVFIGVAFIHAYAIGFVLFEPCDD